MIELTGRLVAETEAAYKFMTDGGRVAWLPKAACDWDPDARTMALPERMAIEKELV